MRLIDKDKLIENMKSVIDNINYVNSKLSDESRNYSDSDWERGFMCAYNMVCDAKELKYSWTFY